RWLSSRADSEGHAAEKKWPPHLCVGLIDGRMRLLRQTLLDHVIDHSDHGEPILGLGAVFQGNALSDGVASRPAGSGHTPADDRDARSGRVVLVAESSAAQQRDS